MAEMTEIIDTTNKRVGDFLGIFRHRGLSPH